MKSTNYFLSLLLVFALSVTAAPLFASQFWGSSLANGTSIQLYQIDVATGSVISSTNIGSGLAFTRVDDLASDPLRAPTVIWAIRHSINGNELIAVDPLQGQLLSLTIIHGASTINSLAIDPSTGLFYGTSGGSLYRIAEMTGNATLVGTGSLTINSALGFDATGNLFGIGADNALVAIDKSTAAMNAIGPLTGMLDIAARPESGVLYGINGPAYDLYQINPINAVLTKVGPSLSRPSGFAFTALPNPIGDFNHDGTVDAADYIAWRKTDGTQTGYDTWRAHFGQTAGSGSGASENATVPEPATALMLMLSAAGWYLRQRRVA